MLFQYWPTAYGAGPTLKQHCVKSLCCWVYPPFVLCGLFRGDLGHGTEERHQVTNLSLQWTPHTWEMK